MKNSITTLVFNACQNKTKQNLNLFLTKFSECYSLKIYNLCHYFVGKSKEDVASDITQETIIKVWKNINNIYIKLKSLPQTENSDEVFENYVFAMAKNLCFDYLRKSKSVDLVNIEEIDKNIEVFEPQDLNGLLGKKLAQIPQKEALAIKLKYWNGFSYPRIAEELKVSTRQVPNIIQRGLQRLRS